MADNWKPSQPKFWPEFPTPTDNSIALSRLVLSPGPNVPVCRTCPSDRINCVLYTAHCPAKHKYCADCIKGSYREATLNKNSWPAGCCGFPFLSTAISISFLSSYEFNLYCEKSMELSTSPANRLYCSRRGCSIYLGSREGRRNAVRCQCGGITCWSCKHPAQLETNTDQISILGSERPFLEVNPGWQRCRDCGTIVENISAGCQHMICGFKESYCYYSGEVKRREECRCRRSDGRLHRGSAPFSPDPKLFLNPHEPGPQRRPSTELISESGNSHPNTLASSPEGSRASPVDTDRPNGYTVYPRIGSFFHKPYPFQLPSVTAQGPSNYYSICRERERWEFAVETRPERHGEGASCLPHLREIYSSTPPLSVPNPLPCQQPLDAPNPETVSSGLQPVSEDSLNQTHQAALSPHSGTENRLQSIARSSDEAEYDWWNESGVRTPPPETFWAPEQEATKWEEAQQERNRRFRLELSPQEVIRRRSTGPNPLKNELLC